MFWQETPSHDRPVSSQTAIDLSCQIDCRNLPVDHAWALSQAVVAVLPWLEQEPGAGVHTIHVAESGNGWARPEGADDLLCLSRRTRLVLRVPRQRVAEARALTGQTLDVAGHALKVGPATEKPLTAFPVVFSRYVAGAQGQDEDAFLSVMVREISALGFKPKKMLCGIEKTLARPEGPVRTRSLMIADLEPDESVLLQQQGLGPLRTMGCGLFLPHKDIRDLKQALE